MRNFRNLEVWKNSMSLVVDVYRLTKRLPDTEKFGLVSQMQRCAVSIPSNIAEGSGRKDKEMIYFLRVALGSSFELETQLILCGNLELLNQKKVEEILLILNGIQRQISSFIRNLTSR